MTQLPTSQSIWDSLQGFGQEQQAALQQNYQNALGMANQSLVQSGLSGTSIAPSMKMGYMKQYQLALNNLNTNLQQTRANVGFQAIGSNQAAQQLGQSQQGLNLQQQGLNQKQQAQDFAQTQQMGQGSQGGQDASVGQNMPGSFVSPYVASMMGASDTSQFGYWG